MNKLLIGYGVTLAVCLVLSAIAAEKDAVTIGLFMGILPGLALLAAPNLLLYGLFPFITLAGVNVIGARTFIQFIAAGVVLSGVAVAASIIPDGFNRNSLATIAQLRADDIVTAQAPGKISEFGLVIVDPSLKGGVLTECGSLCQRLLYDKSVERVLIAASPHQAADDLSGAAATAYWIERRPSCPTTAVPNAGYSIRDTLGSMTISRGVDIAAITKTRIAAGDCLVSGPTSLDAAEIIVVVHPVRRGKSTYDVPNDSFLDTVSARRLSVYRRDEAGLREIFRRTEAKWEPVMKPLLVGVGTNAKLGFARRTELEGAFDLEEVLANRIGLAVGVPDGFSPTREREMVVAALQQDGVNAGIAMVPGYLDRLSRQRSIDAEDFAVIRMLVSDERIRDEFSNIPTYRLGPEAVALAKPLAQRLLAAHPRDDYALINRIAHAIAHMPEGTMAPAGDELAAVARDPARRLPAASALARLADAGPAHVPLLIEIFAPAAGDLPEFSKGRDVFLVPPIGAAQGLCRLGLAAAAVRPYAAAIVRNAVANHATEGWYLKTVAVLLLAHVGGEQDIADAYRDVGGVPQDVSRTIERSLHEPIGQACRLGMWG